MKTDKQPNDGGQAFPRAPGPDGDRVGFPGMTLRDYFEAKAMAAIIAGGFADGDGKRCSFVFVNDEHELEWNCFGPPAASLAKLASEVADAMLAEREKPRPCPDCHDSPSPTEREES